VATFSENDTYYMSLALKLAHKGQYGVRSNPMVGCIITKNNNIIAQGYHPKGLGSSEAIITFFTPALIRACAHGGVLP
jgi:diaminohydroxyphosphoribosylaminopyrimidine deaminase/5-amino-6-(5-phosphoribosylamino)uracil reductase